VSKPRAIVAICNDLERLLATALQELDAVFDIAEEVADHLEGLQAVGLLLSLMERNELVEWGTPGPVVHAVETFFKRGYEPLLLESVCRAPTSHTLWMTNRVLNGVPENQQVQFLSAIRQAANRKDVSEEVRQTALGFLALQQVKL